MVGTQRVVVTADVDPWAEPTVRASVGATITLTVALLAAVIAPDGMAGTIVVAWSLVLFVAGSIAFLWAFVIAAGRSRDEQVTMAGVVWLTNAAPAAIARVLRWSLVAQAVVSVTLAGVRPFSAVAFGILAPMAGLGCLALYGARHGVFTTIGAPMASVKPPVATPAESAERVDPDDFDQIFRRRKRR